jgi:hypothetical protein
MEQRITSLLLPAPEAELEASCKELDEKVTWLLHNSRKMDNYLELEPFSKDGRLCAHVCDTLKSLPETPTLAAYKDYKAIIILLGMSTSHCVSTSTMNRTNGLELYRTTTTWILNIL